MDLLVDCGNTRSEVALAKTRCGAVFWGHVGEWCELSAVTSTFA